jgi:hypothetical protein
LTEWAFVGAVLSCCWSASESAPPELLDYFMQGARGLQTLLPAPGWSAEQA